MLRAYRAPNSELPQADVQDRGPPLLEISIERLRDTGLWYVRLAVNYLTEMIEDRFSGGWDLAFDSLQRREDHPRCIAGCLPSIC